jgi:AAA+ ATPase superfamily predicted ATPase
MFDRDHEWRSLDRFVDAPRPGTTLGVIYGRRRQGKTFLVESQVEARKGLYIPALRQSDSQNLERVAAFYGRHVGARAAVTFRDWDTAFDALLALGEGASKPVPVAIDEFPYLVERAPQLPSLLQSVLRPRSRAARTWRTRLILCGSALSTMTGLLAGSAPLRGRASLDLLVHPFRYRDAAEFWGVSHQPELAARLHALVGGTPAYRDMSGGVGPSTVDALDEWVVSALLDPASAMFREAPTLLAEEGRVTDLATYLSVLGAISHGSTRRGEIAAVVGRAEGALAHPLSVLEEAGFVASLADALRRKRTTYHVAEPIIRFHQLVLEPHEARLLRHRGAAVWSAVQDTVASKIYGPHFEHLAREWCLEHAAPETLGGASPTVVAPTVVACREHRVGHEVDVVAVSGSPGSASRRVRAIGEAKWRSIPIDQGHLDRLAHIRDLLSLPKTVKLLAFSRSGFTRDVKRLAKDRGDVEIIDLDRLYHGT